jgi:hypothetical protein
MAIEINTKVSVGETFGKQKLGNLTLEDAKFFGRPNFSGEEDRFKDSRRKFTVLIPNEVADQLRDIGWNVKTTIPTPEEVADGREPLSHLKVMVDTGSDIWVLMGEDREKLNERTMGVLDRSRIQSMDMEIRAWEYDPEEQPGQFSARLVTLVATIQPNILSAKYGSLL